MTAVLESRDWHLRASCQYVDPALWFPEEDEAAEVTALQADQARRVCLGCPVRRQCLAYALARPEMFGTWGGLTERELRAERNRRPRRGLAEILADADARYFRRQDRRIAANDRRLAAERKHRENAAELIELMRLVA